MGLTSEFHLHVLLAWVSSLMHIPLLRKWTDEQTGEPMNAACWCVWKLSFPVVFGAEVRDRND